MLKTLIGRLALVIFAISCNAYASSQKNYEDVEISSCEASVGGSTNADRMKGNAVKHAAAFCTPAGGVKVGKVKDDFVAKTEGNSPPSCRVTGKIECNK